MDDYDCRLLWIFDEDWMYCVVECGGGVKGEFGGIL